ncbi:MULTISPECIES: PTS N-acetylgalactosamine transporter subunit IIB [Photorhabdus]|uniref:Pts system, n-acetylgalactosamine-specific iib component 2 (Eiib-aga' (N-acetylgalactosamine-permease iib component 2) (Phosphotransferas enzyme ii, b component 2)) n=3 Tax=Photorhabdus TaxID=29487 RepID=B6VMI9_PHOAA|nr:MULTISPECIES: PTS N-acetylgalactosamine transporter subunit IIB [Photorhabdus]OCQ53760.1 Sorbose-specific phosphotransferase enzyme IIB component [Photorhabdus australis subsp. thailandensis]RKS57809.1 PTS system N-acetylgalactosamine-specific EIIB component (Man family) [Photorhabdus asymbiotica]CAQ82867.1 pts system, n-acetylgalactosamine-specific iib component 2 (eiib-aga' (n-acetylgalactosamine-permease iib component 2) (phosphotransferas enzyme ii, b component 2) [Photorhabdus asymbiotic
MSIPNILMTRIDNRLVHGQVGVTWTNSLGANLVLVANDQVASDLVQQNLMDMVVSDGVQTRYFTLQKTIDVIHKAAERQKIFIVCKTPQDVLTLVKGGVPISFVNVGNMHFAEGKRQIHKTVSVDDSDVVVFRELEQLGITCEVRRVPDEAGEPIAKLLA